MILTFLLKALWYLWAHTLAVGQGSVNILMRTGHETEPKGAQLQAPFFYLTNVHWILQDPTLLYKLQRHVNKRTAQMVKNLPAMRETQIQSLDWEDTLEKEMATHSSILDRKIPLTEEPGGLQFTGSQRVGHDWVTNTFIELIFILTGV